MEADCVTNLSQKKGGFEFNMCLCSSKLLEHMSAWDCSRRIFTATCKFQLMSDFLAHTPSSQTVDFHFTLTERSMHVVFLHLSLLGESFHFLQTKLQKSNKTDSNVHVQL